MENLKQIEIQTDKHTVIDFLTKYDLNKIVKCLSASKYTEREILMMCVLKSKGRPPKICTRVDIDTVAVPQKIVLLQQKFNSFMNKLVVLAVEEDEKRDTLRPEYKFMKKKRNILFRGSPAPDTGDGNERVELTIGKLDADKVNILMHSVPKLKRAMHVPQINCRVQLVLGLYLEYIRKSGFFTPVATIDVSSFKNISKPAIFNIFFLLSAFLTIISGFVPNTLLRSFNILMLCYLDHTFLSFVFLRDIDHCTFTGSTIDFAKVSNSVLISSARLAEFCVAWSEFVDNVPSAYRELCVEAERQKITVLRLIGLFQKFAEVFLVLEGFQHRLAQV